MATKKKAAKPAAKKATKPIKKSASAKKPAAKKPAPKKPATATAKKAKPVIKKPAAKKPAKTVKKTAKPVAKSISKKPIKKAMPKKNEDTKAKKPTLKDAMKAYKTKEQKLKSIVKPVIIPKTSTKTARKYQPDFTKSVLDQPAIDLGAPIVRYSDAELAEFKELIQRKLEAAKKELAYLQGLITRKDEMGGDETDNRYMTMEDGSLSMEREQLSQMASRQITFIDHLEKALMRIENKTYGICRVTGKLIDKARLRAVPHATLSIEAKMGIVR
jgi:RNA polymerase-binding transcription factor DksA